METFTIILLTMLLTGIYVVNILCLKHLNINLRNDDVRCESYSKIIDIIFIILSPGTFLITIGCILMNVSVAVRSNRRTLEDVHNSILAINHITTKSSSDVAEVLRSCRDTFEHTNAIIDILNKNLTPSSDVNNAPNEDNL